MKIFSFDIEVFKYDFLGVFENIATKETFTFHNDNFFVKEFMRENETAMFASFNGKHYDNYIISAIVGGANNTIVKDLNDWIIAGNLGFKHYFLADKYFYFKNFDVRDDMYIGLSLKDIEAHLGENIVETSVPFDIDRPLTADEVERTLKYCKSDTATVSKIIGLRKEYLKTKIDLGLKAGLEPAKALYMTNAKLVAHYLGAVKTSFNDERDYIYPSNLDREVIPAHVFEFFDKIRDFYIPSEKLFNMKHVFDLDGGKCTLGFGGIHQAKKNVNVKSDDERILLHLDAEAYYPSIMIINKRLSRTIKNPERFKVVYEERRRRKLEKDKSKGGDSYKLVQNIVYGATLNQWNNLYDPRQGRSVCIDGQLYLLEVSYKCLDIESVELIQLNTDGIILSILRKDLPMLREIVKEWEERTKFNLEEEEMEQIIQKDVNNYIAVFKGGKIKTKGAYLSYGESPFGAWNINNNYTIVKEAIIEYLINNTDISFTINNCNDILKFQYIAKAGSKYKRAYQIQNGKEVTLQKVNRVYASKDWTLSTIYKEHAVSGVGEKISGLPTFCIVDNDNKLKIEDIDKEHYIQKAEKMVNDYLGVKEKSFNRRAVNKMSREILKSI